MLWLTSSALPVARWAPLLRQRTAQDPSDLPGSGWAIALRRFTVSGAGVDHVWRGAGSVGPTTRCLSCAAYPDTGTSLIGVSDNASWVALTAAAAHDGVCSEHTPSGSWECDCERGANQLPSVTIEFANESTPITLSPSQYMVHDGSRCLLGFFDSSEMGMWLLGDRFLVNRYVVYDYDHCEGLPFACALFLLAWSLTADVFSAGRLQRPCYLAPFVARAALAPLAGGRVARRSRCAGRAGVLGLLAEALAADAGGATAAPVVSAAERSRSPGTPVRGDCPDRPTLRATARLN